MKQKVIIVIAVLAICLVAVVAILINQNLGSTMETLEFIEGRYRSGVFVDYDNSIGVEDASDIGWWKKDGNWYVKFGKLELEFTPEDLRNPEMLKAIASVGLDVRGNLDEGELTWYWRGEQLETWVPN